MITEVVPTIQQSLRPPDWDSLGHEVRCPLCEYNLRGLTEPRCPECGYKSTWPELLELRETRHPFLFEHHPERNVVSFVKTFAAGWFPRRFWRKLHARHEIELRRLRLYKVYSTVMPTVLVGMALLGWAAVRTVNENANERIALNAAVASGRGGGYRLIGGQYYLGVGSRWGGWEWEPVDPPWGSLAFFRQVLRHMDLTWPPVIEVISLMSWPWITLATLMIFRGSMRLAKVRTAHVLRCVIYSFDCICVVVAAALFGTPDVPYLAWNYVGQVAVGGMLLLFPVAWYRLGSAYRNYLRFDHPYATALASQLITFLLIAGWALHLNL